MKEINDKMAKEVTGGAGNGAMHAVFISQETCVLCGMCCDVCPTEAIIRDEIADRYTIITAKCTGCGNCVNDCPQCLFKLVPN